MGSLKRRLRRESIKSFKVIKYDLPPATRYIPVNPPRRRLFYERIPNLPEYNRFVRRNMSKEDLTLLVQPWWLVFNYRGKRYRIDVGKGAVFDGASVPDFFVRRNLTKHGSGVQEAALLHDIIFGLHLFGFEDSNNIFVAMLKWTGTKNERSIRYYSFGVRSFIGKKVYDKMDTKGHWLVGYVNFREVVVK